MAASSWARAALLLLCASDLLLLLLLPPCGASAADSAAGTPGDATPPPRKKKKDIRDYNDADMARLLEQWEVRGASPPAGVGGLFPLTSYPALTPMCLLTYNLSCAVSPCSPVPVTPDDPRPRSRPCDPFHPRFGSARPQSPPLPQCSGRRCVGPRGH